MYQVYRALLIDSTFLSELCRLDAEEAACVKEKGCPLCGGVLDQADYPRRPRGSLAHSFNLMRRRKSFCCRRDGCRKRVTPVSFRFMDRKVYLFPCVMVVLLLRSGRAPKVTLARVRNVFGVSPETIGRWKSYLALFLESSAWTIMRSALLPPLSESERDR